MEIPRLYQNTCVFLVCVNRVHMYDRTGSVGTDPGRASFHVRPSIGTVAS